MDWKEHAKGIVNRSGIHYLEEMEKRHQGAGIEFTLRKISEITYDDLLSSWLSIPSIKTVMLFQQMIRKNEIPAKR